MINLHEAENTHVTNRKYTLPYLILFLLQILLQLAKKIHTSSCLIVSVSLSKCLYFIDDVTSEICVKLWLIDVKFVVHRNPSMRVQSSHYYNKIKWMGLLFWIVNSMYM